MQLRSMCFCTRTPLAAIAISGPFGAVKEQSSGLYANQMAERGFIALAFDPSYTGESSGLPRNLASPEINTEDFNAAIDFLGLQKNVERDRIGMIGICGFGGFALNATAIDKRVKAVATTSLYDMTRVMSKGYNDVVTPEQRSQTLEQLGEQRWKDAENGSPAKGNRNLPVELQGNEPQFVKEYFEDIYKAALDSKELMIVPDAIHVDLYDKLDKIPFDKLEAFFKKDVVVQ